MSIKDQLQKMSIGEQKDIVFNNGIARATKTLIRISKNRWEINSFTDGWLTADMPLKQAIQYVKGNVDFNDLKWY